MRLTGIGVLAALLALLSGAAGATTQSPERIIVDGEAAWIEGALPLAAYWREAPEKFAAIREGIGSSSRYRRYLGTWEITDGALWLRKIETVVDGPDGKRTVHDVMNQVFPSTSDVVASWYSGTPIVTREPIIRFDRDEDKAIFARYTLLRIAAGRLERRVDMEGEAFVAYRQARFEAFKQTDDYRRAFEKAREHRVDQSIDPYLFTLEVDAYLTLDDASLAPFTDRPKATRIGP